MGVQGMSGTERLLRIPVVVAIVGGPLGYLLGGLLAPAIHDSGPATIAANAAANPAGNAMHLAAFVLASFLLPVGAAGLGDLGYRRNPRLALGAGLLGVLGWLPFSALTALDDLARAMTRHPGGRENGALLDTFTNDAAMSTYLVVHVAFHLVAHVMLGVILGRGRIIPRWAAWMMAASSPLTIAAFAFHSSARTAVGVAALALLLAGSVPAARAMAAPARART